MSEERIYEDVAVEETVAEENIYQAPAQEPVAPQEPVVAKKGFAKAALVFGILAFITTLFVINYVFGILALIFGIIYLSSKADVKPKGKAITGIVLASLSLIISTALWVGIYNYILNTEVSQIITDVGALIGEEIDGEELLNQTVAEMTGGAVDLATIEQFVGGEISLDKIVAFVGDVSEEELTAFVDRAMNMDEAAIQSIMTDLGGEITYEGLQAKLGEDFSLKELMEYIDKYLSATPQ